ncbi:hypothetical protein [Paenibacillus terreus]|uniref:hypothetical protein n=1 Tax=Paenibacillus terreus TaxID=1387834 RepID=UPI0035CD27BB
MYSSYVGHYGQAWLFVVLQCSYFSVPVIECGKGQPDKPSIDTSLAIVTTRIQRW